MVSMQDIANKLNLSRTTISNILNEKKAAGSYKEETVIKVKATAKKMGYIPNNLARALPRGKTMTLAILVPELTNTYYTDIIKEIEAQCSKAGYQLFIFTSEENIEKENKIIDFLRRQRVDGLLISPVSYKKSLHFDHFPFEVVCFDRYVENQIFTNISLDNSQIAYQLAKTNLSEELSYNLFLGSSPDDITVQTRLIGYQKALEEKNQKIDKIHYEVFNSQDSFSKTLYWLENIVNHEENMYRIFLTSNFVSLGVMKALQKFNIEKFQIIGFERSEWQSLLDVDISFIDQPVYEISKQAFEVLISKINGNDVVSKIIEI